MKFSFLIETPVISTARLAAVVLFSCNALIVSRGARDNVIRSVTTTRPDGRRCFPPRERNSREGRLRRGHEPFAVPGRWQEFLSRNKRIAGTLRYVRV